MFKDEILENERRRKIYALIEANPSVHFRELQRMTDMPLATLEYHLDYMLRKKVVFAESDAYHKRYYTKPFDAADKKILSALRQARMREIVLIVLANTKTKYQFLSDCTKMPHSTLSFYLKHLIDNNILAKEKIGYDTFYTVRDEDRVVRVLTAYKSSFLDKIVDRTLKTWMETRFRGEPENVQVT
jgi:predicted transcriptional regulator